MKQFINPISLGLCMFSALQINAQVILNEVYSEPGAGKQEFFELYNINTSNTPSSLDAYSVISYFKEGSKEGFYVIDLPNLFVASKGYFVGASNIPFSYQGTANSTAANFSWNDPTLPLNYGYLRKWVANGGTAADGNMNYDLETLPVNFNDFFSRRSGSGATYNAFVYKNGTLVNSFFGGTGGNATMPDFITSMPMFKLEVVTASGTHTRVLNFGALQHKPIESIEYVTQDIGSDNGYIKTRDGFCGTWTKSSSTTFHTPGTTNGYADNGATASLNLDTHVYAGATVTDPSFVVYNITSGATTSFPVELQVYLDNGTVEGQLDTEDEFVETNIEHSVNEGPFTTYLPHHADVLIIAKTDAGCIDQIGFAENPLGEAILLPVKFLSLQGSFVNSDIVITWSVAENEAGNNFRVEKSIDGKNFTPAGIMLNSTKTGNEAYSYKETKGAYAYYRIKVVNKDQSIGYSKIILLKSDETTTAAMQLLQNPVMSSLKFNCQSAGNQINIINIYTITGTRLFTTRVATHKGYNTVSLDLNSNMAQGTYVLELISGNQRTSTKFLKK